MTTHSTFVRYIDRTREFYAASGYDRPYRWAHHVAVPFAQPKRTLSALQVTLVTTASPIPARPPREGVLRGDKQVWSGATDPLPKALFTDALGWDKRATHMDDLGSFLPIAALRALARDGRVGAVAPRFHGVPTDYSQRRTLELDAPEVLRRIREDGSEAALLVPI